MMTSIHRIALCLSAMAILSSCTSEDNTSNKTSHQTYSAEQFYETTTVFGSSINHNATAVLVSSDTTGVFNAYRYPLDGSKPTQLTDSTTDTIYGVSWFPEDDRIIYTADQGGNELNHVYVRELSGKVQDLTPGENLKASFSGWSKDGTAFFVQTNERDPKFFDLYRYDTKNYERELVYENNNNRQINLIGPKGNLLVVTEVISNVSNNLYLLNLAKGTETLLTPYEAEAAHSGLTFTPDGKSIIYSTNKDREFEAAWIYNIENKTHAPYYEADWDVAFVYFSEDGKYRVVGTNEDAQTKLQIINTQTNKDVSLPTLPAGDLRGVNFSDDSTKMVFYINSDTSPSNLFTHTLGENKVQRLTDTLNPEINEDHLVASEVRRFKSFDGLEIPGLLYKPKTASADNKAPALIWVHGGPGGQSRKGYSAMIQHLVNHGYTIFSVNNRGSSGYGKTFYHLDDRKHGEDDLQDIVFGKKYLQKLDWVDADRIGIMGGSYGGFMTMAGMAFTDEFKIGINIFGVTNWERTLNSIPPWWESFKKYLYDEMGDPATDAERHRRISPLFHADKIDNPVLIVQGANDPRVLQVESDEMVEEIRKNNVPVEYVLFEDEGHGFRKKANRIEASEAYLNFANKYL